MQGFLFCLTSREAESSGIRLLKPQTVEEFRCYLFLENRIFWKYLFQNCGELHMGPQ